MEKRSWTGWGIVVFGIFLFVVAFEEFFVGLIFIAIGLIIVLNKNEDVIEGIKFNKVKRGVKKNGKK
jgi:hypothetical protein